MTKINDLIGKYIFQKPKEEENKIDEPIECLDKNYVQVEGVISNIGNSFIKKNGLIAKFIDIEHRYEYNDTIRKGNMSIMLEGKVLKAFNDKIKLGDKIFITGNIRNYIDKNNQEKYVINCYDLEVLEHRKEAERQ